MISPAISSLPELVEVNLQNNQLIGKIPIPRHVKFIYGPGNQLLGQRPRDNGMSIWIIIASIVGGVLVLITIIILVYMYQFKKSCVGTLAHHLFQWSNSGYTPLTWNEMIFIGLAIARGIQYLHGLARKNYIHRDLKPLNVLLGDGMRPTISDFGCMKLIHEGIDLVETTTVLGTFGYIDPRYVVLRGLQKGGCLCIWGQGKKKPLRPSGRLLNWPNTAHLKRLKVTEYVLNIELDGSSCGTFGATTLLEKMHRWKTEAGGGTSMAFYGTFGKALIKQFAVVVMVKCSSSGTSSIVFAVGHKIPKPLTPNNSPDCHCMQRQFYELIGSS
ncbi:PREDICTED: leucine-rich repeat receptor-like serine/threonine-protein kinase At1g17230 [Camelina sativa]|uniref:Leucine-rich repeat receptor-like serine/threonine-protein kinase At1g17230 n=1 Tax=Camelina sativa TaxID=90675 RepID=A0ABM1RBQ5_CAMSA|nr:PREDICTED: leucine-rich repeat receptor-like serine/threonine-protein kinase At1g17230 [Camelina sativa]